MARNREFYKDLDEYKQSRTSCSCLGFVLLMVAILAIAEFLLFYIANGVKQDISEQSTLPTVNLEVSDFSVLEENGVMRVVVTEGILCSKISGIRNQNKLACTISEEGVSVSGKIATFLPSNSSVNVLPIVKDGRVLYQVQSVRVGKFRVFQFLAPTISGVFEKAIGRQLKAVSVKEIELDEGIMVIIGEQKI